jgi:hypothetical protein
MSYTCTCIFFFFKVVANYYGKSKQVEFVPGIQIHFGADNDEPSTGDPPYSN